MFLLIIILYPEWRLLNNGSCPVTVAPKKCKAACTREMRPVCGEDQNGETKTFNNKCLYDYAECSETDKG